MSHPLEDAASVTGEERRFSVAYAHKK